MKLGVIADTHGYFAPRIPQALAGVEKIIHAGDLGGREVYAKLSAIAPVILVRGNHEPEEIAGSLIDPSIIDLAGKKILLTHRLITMTWEYFKDALSHLEPMNLFPGVELVIFGHSHIPVWDQARGIWFLNPGYAGPDFREGPPTVALLEITDSAISAEIIGI